MSRRRGLLGRVLMHSIVSAPAAIGVAIHANHSPAPIGNDAKGVGDERALTEVEIAGGTCADRFPSPPPSPAVVAPLGWAPDNSTTIPWAISWVGHQEIGYLTHRGSPEVGACGSRKADHSNDADVQAQWAHSRFSTFFRSELSQSLQCRHHCRSNGLGATETTSSNNTVLLFRLQCPSK